jgi:hypothetical protein
MSGRETTKRPVPLPEREPHAFINGASGGSRGHVAVLMWERQQLVKMFVCKRHDEHPGDTGCCRVTCRLAEEEIIVALAPRYSVTTAGN